MKDKLRYILLVIVFNFTGISLSMSQDLNKNPYHEIILPVKGNTVIINLTPKKVQPIQELIYFWYYKHDIHHTQGNWDGLLLDGSYRVFDKNYNLIEKGRFRNGLKHGVWQKWNSTGKLVQMENWTKGLLNGPYMLYFEDSSTVKKGNYKKSKLNGRQYILQNDSILSVINYRMGIEISSTKNKWIKFPKFHFRKIFKNAKDTL